MPAVTRIGDADVVHCSQPRRQQGSGDVFVNDRGVSRRGDKNTPHKKPGKKCPIHSAAISGGSSTVFVNGRPIGRVGDKIADCTSVAQGSPNVFAG